MNTISILGAVVGIIISVYLIIRKLSPVAALSLGTIIGVLIGGGSIPDTVDIIIAGASNMSGIVTRVIAGGIMAGVLIQSGAMESIARKIVDTLGEKHALAALAISAMLATASGVFITLAFMILAPIALEVGKNTNISKGGLTFALSGGGKAGNIISPNPNTVAAAEAFDLQLSQVMLAGIAPAIIGLIATLIIANRLKKLGSKVVTQDLEKNSDADDHKPMPFLHAMAAPIFAFALLVLGPVINIFVYAPFLILDVLYILPLAGIFGAFVMGRRKYLGRYVNAGLYKIMPVVFTLIGVGALGEMITRSDLPTSIASSIYTLNMPDFLLAPIAGIFMAFVTGSTSTGVVIATSSFGATIIELGIAPLSAAIMIHAGAMVFDMVPQSNLVLVTVDTMKVEMKERMKVMPYEWLVGSIMLTLVLLLYGG